MKDRLRIDAHADGSVLRVRAQPRARRNEIRGVQDGALKVAVTQVPEKGKANHAIRQLLARELGLAKSDVELLGGATQSQKRFLVRGVDSQQLAERLRSLL